MSEKVVLAVIGILATLFGAPLVAWALGWLTTKRAQLFVTMTWNQAAEVRTFKTRIDAIFLEEISKLSEKADRDVLREEMMAFGAYFSASSYLRFSIQNNSKIKLTNLSWIDEDYSGVVKVNDGDVRRFDSKEVVHMGDLQPGRSVTLHAWYLANAPEWYVSPKNRFKFSADALDRVKIVEPLPLRLKRRYMHGFGKWIWVAILFMWGALLGYGIIGNGH